MIFQLQKTFFEEIGKGRDVDVEPQVDGGGNLVDVLPPRALGPNGMEFDLTEGNDNMIRDLKHDLGCLPDLYFYCLGF